MCGIAGLVNLRRSEGLDRRVRAMTSFLDRRGPDHCGHWVGEGVALGHTRLSIIDLDPRSHQPFLVPGLVALTFNGEIYNFPQLRRQLESAGHAFTTTSDTEVIARGYLQWGCDVFAKLDGMFALGLVDLKRRRLLLARDPFGKKPLYVYQSPDEILFSSDLRPITAQVGAGLTLDLNSLDFYLIECAMPQPATVWKEARQVGAATVRQYSLDDLTSTEWRYWGLPSRIDIRDESSALEAVEAGLIAAIRKRTLSDVPLGCFLSGGVDSGLIVSMLAAHGGGRVRTFTVGVKGHPMDETKAARRVVERYDTDHTEIQVEADFEAILQEMSQYCGEPFADSSIVPSYLVTKEISAHLKVALSGDGGDEMFGGYKEYVAAYRADRFLRDHKSRPFWRTRLNLDKMLSRLSGRENMGAHEHYSRLSGAQRLDRQMGFDAASRSRLWRAELRPQGSPGEAWLQQKWDQHPSSWISDQLMRSSLSTRLINDYLVKVDRSSMYHSLEVRSPFLDKSLAELAFCISPEIRFQDGMAKYLLKRLAQKYFDPAIFDRKKHGFSIPLAEWLRATHAPYVHDVLGSRNAWLYSLLDYDEVQKVWARHRAGHDHGDGLWALLCLEAWGQGLKSPAAASSQ